MEIYFQILNLLNTKNIIGVYAATGNPDDDGYLSTPKSRPVVQSAANPESFIDHYQAAMFNEGFFSTQRRIRLGIMLDF